MFFINQALRVRRLFFFARSKCTSHYLLTFSWHAPALFGVSASAVLPSYFSHAVVAHSTGGDKSRASSPLAQPR